MIYKMYFLMHSFKICLKAPVSNSRKKGVRNMQIFSSLSNNPEHVKTHKQYKNVTIGIMYTSNVQVVSNKNVFD